MGLRLISRLLLRQQTLSLGSAHYELLPPLLVLATMRQELGLITILQTLLVAGSIPIAPQIEVVRSYFQENELFPKESFRKKYCGRRDQDRRTLYYLAQKRPPQLAVLL
jgi:hypothetical protein